MSFRNLGVLILITLAASAVLGLCAMADDMAMHGTLCAGDTGVVLCSANPLRDVTLLTLVGLLVIVAAVLAASPLPLRVADSGESLRRGANAPPLIALPLAWAFSDGVLNPKAF